MKRELKFRAWTGRKMLYNVGVHPYLIFRCDDCGILNKQEDTYTEGENLVVTAQTYDVMQFAGLKDKNGKEIYEGDVLKSESTIDISRRKNPYYLVEWGYVGWKATGYNGQMKVSPNLDFKSDFIIIGNVFENPELLK